MKPNALIAILVVLIIVAGVGGTYVGSTLHPQVTSSTVTQTQTVAISGTQTLSAATTTATTTSTVTVNGCNTPSTFTKVTVGVNTISGINAGEYVANSLGFFKQQGLNVTEMLASASVLNDALLTGQINFLITAPSSALSAYAQGEPIISLMTQYDGVAAGGVVVKASLYNSGAVTSVRQLNGHRVGSLSAPSAAFYLTQLYAKYYDANWTQITFTSQTLMINALTTGQIDAAVGLNGLYTAQAVQQGPGVALISPVQQTPSVWATIMAAAGYPLPAGGSIAGNTVQTSAAFIQQHANIVQKYINAMDEAAVWINAHNATEVLSAAYQDPFLQSANESSYLNDVNYLKVGSPANPGISMADWTSIVFFTVASNPTLLGNQTKLLNSYNNLVNTTALSDAAWCYNPATWTSVDQA